MKPRSLFWRYATLTLVTALAAIPIPGNYQSKHQSRPSSKILEPARKFELRKPKDYRKIDLPIPGDLQRKLEEIDYNVPSTYSFLDGILEDMVQSDKASRPEMNVVSSDQIESECRRGPKVLGCYDTGQSPPLMVVRSDYGLELFVSAFIHESGHHIDRSLSGTYPACIENFRPVVYLPQAIDELEANLSELYFAEAIREKANYFSRKIVEHCSFWVEDYPVPISIEQLVNEIEELKGVTIDQIEKGEIFPEHIIASRLAAILIGSEEFLTARDVYLFVHDSKDDELIEKFNDILFSKSASQLRDGTNEYLSSFYNVDNKL